MSRSGSPCEHHRTRSKLLTGAVILVAAYAVGWASDLALADDPCFLVGGETDRTEYVQRWFPARTDCRVNDVLLVRGSSEVFLAMFAFTLAAGVALVMRGRVALRAAAVCAAAVAAFAVIFVW